MVFCAFIEGQGDALTSPGMAILAWQARKDGIGAGLYTYKQVDLLHKSIRVQREQGNKIAVVGFSLGANTATLLSAEHFSLDLLIALDPSQLGYAYHLDTKNTKRSVLWHDANWIMNGPIGHAGLNLGFDVVHECYDFHLFVDMDPTIAENVREELLALRRKK
jgi:hypothetical protein